MGEEIKKKKIGGMRKSSKNLYFTDQWLRFIEIGFFMTAKKESIDIDSTRNWLLETEAPRSIVADIIVEEILSVFCYWFSKKKQEIS